MEKFESKKELLEYAEQAETLTFGEIDSSDRLDNTRLKGGLGQFIEESYFGYEVNSNQEADFVHLGVELKVTPIRELKSGKLSAKERLVLNIINYEEEYLNTFKTSSFWMKNSELLIMFYLWRSEWKRSEYPIIKAMLHTFSEKDLLIIEQDWKTIIEKIKAGKAHELSEGDTNYLGAATKGSSSASVRKQPFNSTPAMQRAYSLKQSYMTALVRSKITKADIDKATSLEIKTKRETELPPVIKDVDVLRHKKFDDYVIELFSTFKGWSREELVEHFKIVNKDGNRPKQVNYIIVQRILGVGGNSQEVHAQEFEKANIVVKTIELNDGKSPREHLKICEINEFNEITDIEWEDSTLFEKLESTKFLFVIFDKTANGSVILKKAQFWSMPVSDLEQVVKKIWQGEKQKINEGVKLTYKKESNKKGYVISNNLIKATDKQIIHIRPSAAESQYCGPYRRSDNKLMNNARQLPVSAQWFNRPKELTDELQDDWMTKQAFWLNNSYIFEEIKD